jgi:hypothetical protein
MRTKFCLVLAVVIIFISSPALAAGNLKIVPTTTLQAQTSNNSSAAKSFKTQTNGNIGGANVSKVDIHSLLYPGANTKIIAHFMPWWGDSRHINVGYNSHDPKQIHSQIVDMISRGVDGVIIDWYGDKDYTDYTAKLVMAEAEQHPGFTFAIMVDKGAISLSGCSGCSPQTSLIQQVQYVEQTYVPSPAYMRVNGRPVITNFDIDLHYSIDWNAVQKATSTNPDFIFQHASGFTHNQSAGSYAWVIVNVTDFGMSYLGQFYQAGAGNPRAYAIGGAYKGFNDTLASWGQNRIVGQQCGQTWLQTFSRANGFYNSGKQLDAMQLVTWNDYEEGTEIETGIDNCLSLTASLSGGSLDWKISGNENTIDHYVVYISTDGRNLMSLSTAAPGNHSLNLASYQFAGGKYTVYVQAVGKPTIINHISNPVNYSVSAPQPGPPAPPPSGNSASISVGASPASVSVAAGQPAKTTVTVTPGSGSVQSAVALSCSNLPVGTVCTFSPATVTPGSKAVSSSLMISTSAIAAVRGAVPVGGDHPGYGLFLSIGVVGMAISGSWVSRKRIRQAVAIAALTLGLALLTACGGGATPIQGITGATIPTGTFAITVNGDSGSQHTSTTITLTVQ